MNREVAKLAETLEGMTPEQLVQVANFVDLLRSSALDRVVTRSYAQASEAAFSAIWDNPDDDVYDAL